MVNRTLDVAALVVQPDKLQPVVSHDPRVQFLHHVIDKLGHFQGVRVRLGNNRDHDPRFAVLNPAALPLLVTGPDVREVAHLDDAPPVRNHDDVLDVIFGLELRHSTHAEVAPTHREVPRRHVHVVPAQRRDHLVNRRAVRRKPVRLQHHVHLATDPTPDLHFRDARHALEILLDVLLEKAQRGVNVNLVPRQCLHCDHHDRIGLRTARAQHRLVHVLRIRRDLVQLVRYAQ